MIIQEKYKDYMPYTRFLNMVDDFTIEGKVVDHKSNVIKGVYVEAYNSFTCFPPNFLGMIKTKDNGEFKLKFPKENYFFSPGCIDNPNIFLIIRNQYKKLLKTDTRSNVHEVSPENVFNVTIPAPEPIIHTSTFLKISCSIT